MTDKQLKKNIMLKYGVNSDTKIVDLSLFGDEPVVANVKDIVSLTKEYALSVLPRERKLKYGRSGSLPYEKEFDRDDIFHYGEDVGFNQAIKQAKENII